MTENFYGTFKYAESKYGASTQTDRLRWAIQAAWEGEDFTTSENMADMVIDMRIRRGRDFFIRLDGQNEASGFQSVRPGSLTITLDDPDLIYDPNNTDSPLYPNVEPGAPIRVLVRVMPDTAKIPLFAGEIIDIQSFYVGSSHRVTISAVDDLQKLSDINILSDVEDDISVSEAVSEVLDLAAWPSGLRSIQSSDITIPYWWDKRRAYTAIDELVETEAGYFFVDAAGNAVFYSRDYAPAVTATIQESEMLKNIILSKPWETVRNFIRAVANPVKVGSLSNVWTLDYVPIIGAGGTLILWAVFSDAAIDLVSPVATTDYLANANAGGTGTNLTASVTVSMQSNGQSARLEVFNGSSSAAYITLLKIRGKPLEQNNAARSEISIGAANRLFESDTPWRQTIQQANQYAARLSLFISKKQTYPTIKLENQFDKQFGIELFDHVTVTIPKNKIDSTFVVGLIEHRWLKSNGQAVETTLTLEPTRTVSDSLLAMSAQQAGENTSAHISFGIIPEISNLPARTITAWIYPQTSTRIGYWWLVSWNDQYILGYDPENKFIRLFTRLTSNPGVWHTPGNSITPEQWQQITVTHDRSSSALADPIIYINGVSQVLTEILTPAGTPNSETNTLIALGNYYQDTVPYTRAFPGLYRDVRIYDRILTAQEADDLFDGVAVDDTGLLFHALYIAKNRLSEYNNNPLGTKQVFDIISFYIGTTTDTSFPIIRAFDYEP